MQKKLYLGGLPWELDRIGLLNYFKAILEGTDIAASYELPFVASPLINPNATIRVVDVFVALDRQTNKSRGFGFITLDILGDNAEEMFNKIVDMLNGRVLIGIRGPRELIVKEADPRTDAPRTQSEDDFSDNAGFTPAEVTESTEDSANISW